MRLTLNLTETVWQKDVLHTKKRNDTGLNPTNNPM